MLTDTCRVSPARSRRHCCGCIPQGPLRVSFDTPGHQCPKYLAADAVDRAGLPHQLYDHVRPLGQRHVVAVVTEGIVDLPKMVEQPTLKNFGLVDNKRAYIED